MLNRLAMLRQAARHAALRGAPTTRAPAAGMASQVRSALLAGSAMCSKLRRRVVWRRCRARRGRRRASRPRLLVQGADGPRTPRPHRQRTRTAPAQPLLSAVLVTHAPSTINSPSSFPRPNAAQSAAQREEFDRLLRESPVGRLGVSVGCAGCPPAAAEGGAVWLGKTCFHLGRCGSCRCVCRRRLSAPGRGGAWRGLKRVAQGLCSSLLPAQLPRKARAAGRHTKHTF